VPEPDKNKKVVDQTGYNQEEVVPFEHNYRELYREQLQQTRIFRDELDKYLDVIKNIQDDELLSKEVRYIYKRYIEIHGEDDDE
tara:strand:+ start:46 stop:297 length:252 start_codon:yes stop_codon:yes gene_type:complete